MSLWWTLDEKHGNYVKEYIRRGGDVNITLSLYGLSLITNIMIHERKEDHEKNKELINFLIDSGIDRNIVRNYDDHGTSPFHLAVFLLAPDYIELFLEKGFDINIYHPNKPDNIAFQQILKNIRWKYNGKYSELEKNFEIMLYFIENGSRFDCKFKGEDYIWYLDNYEPYKSNRELYEKRLIRSFEIRYSKQSLLKLCAYHIKINREQYKDGIKLLNRDIKKLININQ